MARNEARHAVVLDAEMDILKRKFGDMEGMLRKLVGKEYKIDVGLNMPMMDAHVQKYQQSIGKITQLQEAAAQKAKRIQTSQNVQLAAQIQDFGIQVAGGQNPLLAAVQQGSQLSFIYGGFGNALKALASTLTPVNIGIAALVGSVGAVALGFIRGAKESDALTKSLLLSGNAASINADKFALLLTNIEKVSGKGASDVRELANALVGTGRGFASQIESISPALLNFQKLSGKTAQESAQMFAAMQDDPSGWVQSNNKAFNLVTNEQAKFIKRLQESGKSQEAYAILSKAVIERWGGDMSSQFSAMDGYLAKASKGWQSFWGWVNGLGRAETAFERLDSLNEKLKRINERSQAGKMAGDALRNEISSLNRGMARNVDAQIDADALKAKQIKEAEADALKSKLSGANDSLNAALAELAATKQALPLQLEIAELKQQEAMLADEALKDNLRYVIADKERLLQMREIAKLQKELASVKGGDSEEKNLAAAAKRAAIEKQIIDAQVKLANMPTGGNLIDASINKSNKSVIDEGKKRLEALLAAQLKYNEDALKLSVDLQAETAKIKASELTDTTSRARAELEIEAEKKREIIAKAKEGSDESIKAQKAFEDWYMASQARITDEFKKRTDAQSGMSEALQKYYEELQNKGKIAGDATVKILQSIEDTMLNVVKNGKLDFKSLVDTILTEFYRLQIVKPLMETLMGEGGKGGMLGNLIQNVVTPSGGGGSSNVIGDIITLMTKGFASGGYTGYGNTNQPAGIVHKGEYVMPKSAVNRIGLGNLENMKNGGSSSPVIHISIDSSTDRAYVQQLVASGVQRGLSVYHGQVQRGLA